MPVLLLLFSLAGSYNVSFLFFLGQSGGNLTLCKVRTKDYVVDTSQVVKELKEKGHELAKLAGYDKVSL